MRSNKVKDMIRSILPSKSRKGARADKALRKRGHRHGVRQDLVRPDVEESKIDVHRDAFLSDVVWDRRSADKLNHFMRWCKAKTKGMDTEEALDYVRGLLPSSLIGDHAYGHWEAVRKPRPWSSWTPRYPEREIQSFVDSTTFRLKRALGIAPDLHHALNAEIKRRKMEGEPRRPLRGVHDAEAFVRDIAWPLKRGEDDLFYVERRVTLDLVERIEKGGREAALPVSALQNQTGVSGRPKHHCGDDDSPPARYQRIDGRHGSSGDQPQTRLTTSGPRRRAASRRRSSSSVAWGYCCRNPAIASSWTASVSPVKISARCCGVIARRRAN
jgi:hypothetical protein